MPLLFPASPTSSGYCKIACLWSSGALLLMLAVLWCKHQHHGHGISISALGVPIVAAITFYIFTFHPSKQPPIFSQTLHRNPPLNLCGLFLFYFKFSILFLIRKKRPSWFKSVSFCSFTQGLRAKRNEELGLSYSDILKLIYKIRCIMQLWWYSFRGLKATNIRFEHFSSQRNIPTWGLAFLWQ